MKKDKKYQNPIKNKVDELTKLGINKSEQKKYVLLNNKDIEILRKCKVLEKISKNSDKRIVNLIKTQLEEDWRTPLIKYLDKMSRKYNKS